MFLVRYASGADPDLILSFGGSGGDRFTGVDVDDSGNIAVLGSFVSPDVSFGEMTLTSMSTDGVVVKLSR
jgi:hypothetical protein